MLTHIANMMFFVSFVKTQPSSSMIRRAERELYGTRVCIARVAALYDCTAME